MNLNNSIPVVYQSAKSLAHQIQSKFLSATELATEYLKQIEIINPNINAIFQVDKERILSDAGFLDAELSKGRLHGPLHGVPISIKDNLLTKGIITTGGSCAWKDHIAQCDATVVKRLRNAGAIILGKTNLPDFALAFETESTAYGCTRNPYRLNCTAGGSSGGEAALLASGGSALGIGTDSGGSIRLPAHYCGIAGLRPSKGLLPSTGHFPPDEGYPVLGVFAALNSIGPMARYVEDLQYSLPILAGADGVDPYAENAFLHPYHEKSCHNLRISLYPTEQSEYIHPDIYKTLQETARYLKTRGCIIEKNEPSQLHTARDLYCSIVGADGGEGVRALLQELNYAEIPLIIQRSLSRMEQQPSLRKYLDTVIQWDLFRIHLLNHMQLYDILLCPVANHTALPLDESFSDDLHFSHEKYLLPITLMGWPSVTVRAGTSSEGMPIGLQVIAKHGYDYLALHVFFSTIWRGSRLARLSGMFLPISRMSIAGVGDLITMMIIILPMMIILVVAISYFMKTRCLEYLLLRMMGMIGIIHHGSLYPLHLPVSVSILQ